MKDNNTGKNSDFYALGKKMFDRLNPPGTPAFKPYFPKREWIGLTDDQINTIWKKWIGTERANKSYTLAIEAKLKELNHD